MTDQEINEFLAEKCGFRYQTKVEEARYGGPPQNHWNLYDHWIYPDGVRYEKPPNFLDPERGMGLLFKYARPILRCNIEFHWELSACKVHVIANGKYYKWVDPGPTRALALAIYKAFGGEQDAVS